MTSARFSAETLAGWRKTLEAEAASLRNAIAYDRQQLDGRADAMPAAFDDGRDEAQLDAMRDIEVSELTRRAHELEMIEAALARIADGIYGTCVSCGDYIPVERLRASPHSLTCLACQSAHERSHGAPSHPPRL